MAPWLLCILINNPNHNKILPFPFPPHVLSSSPTCRTSTHISGTDQTCPFPPPVLFGKNHEEVPALISWSSYMLADPRLKKEYMLMVAWFDPFSYIFIMIFIVIMIIIVIITKTMFTMFTVSRTIRPSALIGIRFSLRCHSGETNKQLINDWTPLFGASVFVFLSAPKEQANNLNSTATQKRHKTIKSSLLL